MIEWIKSIGGAMWLLFVFCGGVITATGIWTNWAEWGYQLIIAIFAFVGWLFIAYLASTGADDDAPQSPLQKR